MIRFRFTQRLTDGLQYLMLAYEDLLIDVEGERAGNFSNTQSKDFLHYTEFYRFCVLGVVLYVL